jgi:Tfp pilus assembly protein PilN
MSAQGFDFLKAGQWALVCVIALAAGWTAWLGWESRALTAEAIHYESTTARLQEINRQFARAAATSGIDLSPERLKTLGREVSFMNHVLQKRAFSWTQLLTSLEETVPPGISLVSVTLNFTDSTVSLSGASLSVKHLTGFVNNLETHPAFSNVLLSHHRVKDNGGRAEIKKLEIPNERLDHEATEFTMTAVYRAGG